MQKELDLAIEKINQKKFEEAINIYEKILESTPNHLDSNLNLGTFSNWKFRKSLRILE